MTAGIDGMSVYGAADETESLATPHRALELGINLLDTADHYGPMLNERLVAKCCPADITLATKFGFEVSEDEKFTGKLNGRPEHARKSIERSLRNPGTDYVDRYHLHRPDPETPLKTAGL